MIIYDYTKTSIVVIGRDDSFNMQIMVDHTMEDIGFVDFCLYINGINMYQETIKSPTNIEESITSEEYMENITKTNTKIKGIMKKILSLYKLPNLMQEYVITIKENGEIEEKREGYIHD